MAGEEAYINPIIQAMQLVQQKKQSEGQLALETARLKESSGHNTAVLQELQRQHDLEHEYQSKVLEGEAAMREAQRQRDQATQAGTLIQLAQSGAAPELLKMFPGVTSNLAAQRPGMQMQGPPPGPMPPGVTAPNTTPGLQFHGADIPLDALQQAGMNKMTQAAAQAGLIRSAQNQADEPFEERQFGRTKELKGIENAYQKDRDRLRNEFEQGKYEEEIKGRRQNVGIEQAGENARANARNRTEMIVRGFNPDDPQGDTKMIETIADSAALGKAKLNPDRPLDNLAIQHNRTLGRTEIDPTVPKALQKFNELNDVLSKAQEFASNLPTTAVGGLIRGAQTHAPFGLSTKAKSDYEALTSDALKVGAALESNSGGRVNIKQLGLEVNSLPLPTDTRENAQAKIQALVNRVNTVKHNVLLGGIGDEQKKQLYNAYGAKDIETATGPNGHKIVTYDGGKNVYDFTTGEKIKQ